MRREAVVELTEWEKNTLKRMLAEYLKSVNRKRSWQPSVAAMSKADAILLTEKILGEKLPNGT
jgi:hypothetical protein